MLRRTIMNKPQDKGSPARPASPAGHVSTLLWRVFGALGLAAFVLLTVSPDVRAEPSPDPTGTAHIARSLDDVAVSSPTHDTALASVERTRADLAADEARLDAATERITTLRTERDRLDALIVQDTAVRSAADAEIFILSARLRGLALQAYVGISNNAEQDAAFSLDDTAMLRARSTTTLRDAVLESTHAEYEEQLEIAKAAARRLKENSHKHADTQAELDQSKAESADAGHSIEENRKALFSGLATVRDARATAIVNGTDLPLVVLDAYVSGAQLANERAPGCHLDWSLLAGIGKIESGQGTHGGAVVRADGTLTRPIVGIPLNGDHDTQVIRTSDGAYMRAQGPMQFLPSTWEAVAADGDEDGRADIQNLYDAAATAGVYLCRSAADLSGEVGRRRAILSYNFSGAYVADVTLQMRRYADTLPELTDG